MEITAVSDQVNVSAPQNKKHPIWVLVNDDQVFACGEDSHTLRLASELADLRVGNVN